MFLGVTFIGDKIQNGYITLAFWGAHEWAEVLHNPCILGVPFKGGKIKSGYITWCWDAQHRR